MEKYEIKQNKKSLPEKFNRNELLSDLEFVRESYVEFFLRNGFSRHTSVDIIAKETDPSVFFIGSTISPLKHFYLDNEIPQNGVVIAQPCIRTHNMKNLYTDNPNKGNTFFNLIGGLAEGNKFKDVCAISLKYFNEELKIPRDRIFARASSLDDDLIENLKTLYKCPELEIDGRKSSYYRWRYGIKGVTGRGIALAIRNTENRNNSMTLGNVIMMESSDHPSAIQWGYGIESIVSGFYSKEKVIEGSLISQVVPYEKSMLPKFADALVAVIEMYNLGLKPDNKGEASYLRGYLKGLAFWAKRLKIDEISLRDYVIKYCKLKNVVSPEKFFDEIIKEMNFHNKNVNKLEAYLKTAHSAVNKENKKFSQLIKQLSNKYRINPEEVNIILNAFLKTNN